MGQIDGLFTVDARNGPFSGFDGTRQMTPQACPAWGWGRIGQYSSRRPEPPVSASRVSCLRGSFFRRNYSRAARSTGCIGQKRDLGDPSLALSDGCNGLRTDRSSSLPTVRTVIPLRRLPPRRSWFQSPVPRVKRRKRRNGFRQSGADWETAAACVKMETESSVTIRPPNSNSCSTG